MKKFTSVLSHSVVLGLLMTACSSSKIDITPASATQSTIISEKLALTKSLQKTWNTELVKEKDVLVYARNSQNNSVDYSKFQLDLKNDAKFSMIDREGNKIEGEWFVAEGNVLNLSYDKEDFNCSSTTISNSQICTVTMITVNIAFNLVKVPTKDELQIQNNSIDYVMKTVKVQ